MKIYGSYLKIFKYYHFIVLFVDFLIFHRCLLLFFVLLNQVFIYLWMVILNVLISFNFLNSYSLIYFFDLNFFP